MVITFNIHSFFWTFPALLYYGSEIKGWQRSTRMASVLAKQLAQMKLLFNVLFLHPPILRDKDIISCPVTFLFADYHRLSSIGGEQALAKIVVTLFEAAETHFGVLPVRLFCALKASYGKWGNV
jgi:ankyrin repeat-rich membrane spanning protein